MALRAVLSTASRAPAAAPAARMAAAASAPRFFSSDAAKEAEAAAKEAAAKEAALAAENALMEQLQKQQAHDAEVTVMPFHASERVFPSVEDAPMPFPSEVSLLTGTEEWMKGRKVRIFKPARHQMQSGTYNTKHWEIRFEKNRTWENPLMGWTSTKDMTHQLDSLLKFDTAEEAQAYAEKHGWEMELEEPAALGDFSGKISYSHNFLPLDIENMVKREGKKSHVQFKHPTGRRSNWVKTLKYHGDGVVAQHGGEAKE